MANEIETLLAELEPAVRRAFLEAVATIKSEAQMAMLVDAIDRRDIEGVLQIMQLKPEMFGALDAALVQARIQGGMAAMAALPLVADPFPAGAWLRGLISVIQERNCTSPRNPRA